MTIATHFIRHTDARGHQSGLPDEPLCDAHLTEAPARYGLTLRGNRLVSSRGRTSGFVHRLAADRTIPCERCELATMPAILSADDLPF